MRTFLLCIVALGTVAIPASAITVISPANGAQVAAPFNLVASTSMCGSVPAVSMGYSIDGGQAVIAPTSFSARVLASPGPHVLHVKCWGVHVNDEMLLNITVVRPRTITSFPLRATFSPATITPGFSPAPGTYTTEQSVTLSATTPGSTIYYTTDGSAPTTSSPQYTQPIAVSSSQVIQAVAVAPGFINSGLARADYVITPATGPVVPPNAISATGIQNLNTWIYNHDAGTPGTAQGVTSLVSTPSLSGSAREFDSSYTTAGGEIYSVPYASDTTSMNFAYDAWVWIQAGSSIANLEMDSNQVIASGNTVIYAFQCDGYSHTWDYSGAGASWVRSTQPCNLSTWSTNTWHHIQITYSRDNSGNVTYQSVWLDGNEQVINATVPSSFALGWKVGVVQTQFQLDGLGASGSSTVYLDNLAISRW